MRDQQWPPDADSSTPVLAAPDDRSPQARQETRHSGSTFAAVALVSGMAMMLLGLSAVLAVSLHEPRRTVVAHPPVPPPTPSTSDTPVSAADRMAQSGGRPAEGDGTAIDPELSANPLHSVGSVRPIRCGLPPFDPSTTGQQRFFDAALPCLDRAWRPVLHAAGVPFHGPRVHLVTAETNTPCGARQPTQTALYCGGTIYMTASYYRDVEQQGARPGAYFGQLSHEYGHHVQYLAGVMKAAWDHRHDAGAGSPEGLEVSRRFELQATCLSGMFLAAAREGGLDPSLVSAAVRDSSMRGDYPDGGSADHGRPDTNAAWVRHGFEGNSTGECNTWQAVPAAVG